MSVRISAVVCTHNRAAYLHKALQSLVDQTLDGECYEIIVVDNASTDRSREVVSEYSGVPNLRYVYEPIAGLSRARNTGWGNARGEYVAYLDDDAVARPGWLAKLLEVFEDFEPTPGSVGGKVEAIWEAPKPDWLSDKLLGYLAIADRSDIPLIMGEWNWLAGCNIAYPRELLQVAAGFREDLGRQGTTLRTGEEAHLGRRLASMGFRSVYHPEIVVSHHVSPLKLTKKWFRERAYWQGLSNAIMLDEDGRLSLCVRTRLTVSRIGWLLPRLLLMVVGTNAAGRFRRQCQVLDATGFISGLWRRVASREPG